MSNGESTALAVVSTEDESPAMLMRRATDVASLAKEIVLRTAIELKGKRYVKVESWQTIASLYGCSPSIREVIEEERGVKAIAELKRHADGRVIAVAEGFCGLDEATWASRPAYARRGMAQTRAISRVCRSAFAFVVVMIDAKLETTPVEEIPEYEVTGAVVNALPSAPLMAKIPSDAPAPVKDKSTQVKFGRAKGKYLCDIDQDDLDFQLAAARRSVAANDPTWHKKNVEWLEKVEAEVDRRSGTVAGSVRAPAEASPKVAKSSAPYVIPNDDGEEIVTPLKRLVDIAKAYGLTPARLTSMAKGILGGKDSGFSHQDLDRVAEALAANPPKAE